MRWMSESERAGVVGTGGGREGGVTGSGWVSPVYRSSLWRASGGVRARSGDRDGRARRGGDTRELLEDVRWGGRCVRRSASTRTGERCRVVPSLCEPA